MVRGGVRGAVRYPTTVSDAAIALGCRIIAAQRPRTEFFKRFQLPSSAPSAMTLPHCLCSGAEHLCTAQARRSVRPPIAGFSRILQCIGLAPKLHSKLAGADDFVRPIPDTTERTGRRGEGWLFPTSGCVGKFGRLAAPLILAYVL